MSDLIDWFLQGLDPEHLAGAPRCPSKSRAEAP